MSVWKKPTSGGRSSASTISSTPHEDPRAKSLRRRSEPKYPDPPVTSARMSNPAVLVHRPLQAASHAVLQSDRWIVPEGTLGLRHRARNGLVHLPEHVDLLMVDAQ